MSSSQPTTQHDQQNTRQAVEQRQKEQSQRQAATRSNACYVLADQIAINKQYTQRYLAKQSPPTTISQNTQHPNIRFTPLKDCRLTKLAFGSGRQASLTAKAWDRKHQ
jgi:hypothetical protein